MIAALLPLLGLGVPKWLAPWMKWAIDIAIIAAALLALYALHGHWERKAHDAAFAEGVAQQKKLTDAEIAKNAIQRTSIDTLTTALNAKNAESDRRAQALADAKAQDVKDRAAFDKRYAATAGRVAQLEAIARVPGGSEACRAPKAVSDALEGL